MMKRLGWRATAVALVALLLAAGCSSDSKPESKSSGTPTTAAAAGNGKHAKKAEPGDESAGDPSSAAYTPTGTLIADNGFRPEKDGFAFENYGATLPPDPARANLGPAEMRKLFGDKVCSDLSSGKCDLTPPAQQWMDQQNKGTDGGHCQGFSVLSGLFWKGVEKPSQYGGDSTPALEIKDNEPLQREIAYAFMYQTLDAYNAAIVKGTPNDILDKLIQVLKPDNNDSYTIGIYKRGFQGGHAVTPFAVEDNGNGLFHVLIYDNNYPKVTRAIAIDRNKNAWSYDAATNPQNPSEVYEGDADSKTIDVEPTSAGVGVQPCPFCGDLPTSDADGSKGAAKGSAAAAPQLDEIYLDGSDSDHAHLLITDPQGRRLGIVGGNFVSEIPGAHAVFSKASKDWNEEIEPDYYVPDGVDYSITIDGTGLQEEDDTEVGLIGPSFDATIGDLTIQPGEKATLKVAADVTKLSFTSNKDQTPSIDVGLSEDVDYEFTISGATIKGGTTLDITRPLGSDDMTFTSVPGSSYDLAFDRTDDEGQISFKHDGVALGDGDTAVLHFGAFKSHGDSVALDVTHAGSKKTQQLTNQAS